MTITEIIISFFILMIAIQVAFNVAIFRQVMKSNKALEALEKARKCGFDVKAYLDELDNEESKWIEREM